MAKKRTKAQRSAAAKAAHAARKARLTAAAAPASAGEVKGETGVVYMHAPRIVYAVKEGGDIYACFASDGSLNRERLSDASARKLLRDLSSILLA